MENTNKQDDLTMDNRKKTTLPTHTGELPDSDKPEETEISGEELETVTGGRINGHRPPPLGRSTLIL